MTVKNANPNIGIVGVKVCEGKDIFDIFGDKSNKNTLKSRLVWIYQDDVIILKWPRYDEHPNYHLTTLNSTSDQISYDNEAFRKMLQSKFGFLSSINSLTELKRFIQQ